MHVTYCNNWNPFIARFVHICIIVWKKFDACLLNSISKIFWLTVPVLEESESLMSPDSNQTFYREALQWFECLVYTSNPSRHLTRRVYVVRLHVLCEILLKNTISRLWGRSSSNTITEVSHDRERSDCIWLPQFQNFHSDRLEDHVIIQKNVYMIDGFPKP